MLIELMALLLGCGFIVIAKRAAQRARFGGTDSVWALKRKSRESISDGVELQYAAPEARAANNII